MPEILWKAPTNVTSPISGVTINSGAGSLGSEYDNETNNKRMAAFELTFEHATAPTSGEWLLYLLYAIDGTNYEDGGASTQPKKMHVAVFNYRASSVDPQKITVFVPIKPFKFKPLVWNATNQNSEASAVTLDMEVFGEDPQSS